MSIIRLLVSISIAGLFVLGLSIAWPKLTSLERPAALTDVRNFAMSFPTGKSFADVLGVSDESSVSAQSSADLISRFTVLLTNKMSQSATELITRQAVIQLSQTFNSIPEKEKIEIKKIVCTDGK